jgi:GNAT superfamily N-acetyltransferase
VSDILDARAGLQFHPATAERWPDLEELFGERGACGGCWCMWWRLRRSQFERQKGLENMRAFRAIVDAGEPPGLLGYMRDQPIAWCAVAPRESYPALERSRILRRVDDAPVWSIVCLFVARPFRRQGITAPLLAAAVAHASRYGATIVEGYPVEPKTADMPAAFAWTGTASAFRRAGFTEVVRRSATRPIMRYVV